MLPLLVETKAMMTSGELVVVSFALRLVVVAHDPAFAEPSSAISPVDWGFTVSDEVPELLACVESPR